MQTRYKESSSSLTCFVLRECVQRPSIVIAEQKLRQPYLDKGYGPLLEERERFCLARITLVATENPSILSGTALAAGPSQPQRMPAAASAVPLRKDLRTYLALFRARAVLPMKREMRLGN